MSTAARVCTVCREQHISDQTVLLIFKARLAIASVLNRRSYVLALFLLTVSKDINDAVLISALYLHFHVTFTVKETCCCFSLKESLNSDTVLQQVNSLLILWL